MRSLSPTIGALNIRIGFWGPSYSNYNKAPQNSIGNYFGPYITPQSLLSDQQHAKDKGEDVEKTLEPGLVFPLWGLGPSGYRAPQKENLRVGSDYAP